MNPLNDIIESLIPRDETHAVKKLKRKKLF